MADNTQATEGTAPVKDRRPTPQGVLPRRMQMWLMLGLAFGILASRCTVCWWCRRSGRLFSVENSP
jgi:hypothetical protein